jgi:dTDP-4-amino-4,6-dideoxygalactose transaminase
MEGMQGASLRVKLRHLERWTEARRAHAALYDLLLKDSGVVTPRQMPYARHVYTVYAIRTPRRDALGEALKAADIQYGIHYPVPVHLQRAYRDARYELGAFPIAERVAGEVLSLPIYPELQRAQIERISEVVRSHAAA